MDDDDELLFCWDDSKAASNLEKHRVSFQLATFVFDDSMRLERMDEFAEGEYRRVATGTARGRLVTVVYTTHEDNLYRLISARLATAAERDTYEQNLFQS